MDNNYYKSPKSSYLKRVFWRAAGADRYLLERSTYSDQIKYFCLGGIVIATGVMAAMAGGYAIYMIFEPKGPANETGTDVPTAILATFFGIIWGLIIYNIDRFIVTSTGKGDGTEAITGQEFRSAIPRIIMGLIIALTISKPIEIRMFKSEIDQELFQKQEQIKVDDKLKAELKFQGDIEKQELEIVKIDSITTQSEARYWHLEADAKAELDGSDGSTEEGAGPIYDAKQALADNAKIQWESLRDRNGKRIKKIEKKLYDLETTKQEAITNAETKAEQLDGLLERLKLAHEVAGFWISLFITLLFIVIELTPIFFKMMLIKGPYDYMDENVRELARAEAGIEVVYNFYEDKNGIEAHKVINHAAHLKAKERLLLLKAQEELNEEIVKKWKRDKMKDIDKNPSDYISED